MRGPRSSTHELDGAPDRGVSQSSNQKVVSVFYELVSPVALLATSTHDRSIKAVFFWLVIILIVVGIVVAIRRLGSGRRKRSAPDDWRRSDAEDESKERP